MSESYYGFSIDVSCVTYDEVIKLVSRLEQLFKEKLMDDIEPLINKNEVYKKRTIKDVELDNIINNSLISLALGKEEYKEQILEMATNKSEEIINKTNNNSQAILRCKLADFLIKLKAYNKAFKVLDKVSVPKDTFFKPEQNIIATMRALEIKSKIFFNNLIENMDEKTAIKEIKKNIKSLTATDDYKVVDMMLHKLSNPSETLTYENKDLDPETSLINTLLSITDEIRSLKKEVKQLKNENKQLKLNSNDIKKDNLDVDKDKKLNNNNKQKYTFN